MAGPQQQIIIKRVKKVAGGHHGGAWKVAYADFVTAMMAFFLLLWLLNAVTQEQLTGISNYFTPTTTSKSAGGDATLDNSDNKTPKAIMKIALPKSSLSESLDQSGKKEGEDGAADAPAEIPQEKNQPALDQLSPDQVNKILEKEEQKNFENAKAALERAIHDIPAMKKYEGSFMVDNTPEGLRIQITDQDGLAMFPSGSPAMYGHTKAMLSLVAAVIRGMPNKVAISGHTDAKPFRNPDGYGNWELSADRALASRRALIEADLGVPENRIARVVGRADTEPLEKDINAPRNRRISIILLRENDLLPPPTMPAGPGVKGP